MREQRTLLGAVLGTVWEWTCSLSCAWYRFVVWLVRTLRGFPRSQRSLLGDRMQVTTMDVLDLLVTS